jgi:hypothetical protein
MIVAADGRPSYFCKCRPLADARLRHEMAVLTTIGADRGPRDCVPRTWGVNSEGLQLLFTECVRGTPFDRSVVNLSEERWADSMTEILAVESRLSKKVAYAMPQPVERSVVIRALGKPLLSYLASAGLLGPEAVSAMEEALRRGGRVDAHLQHGDLRPQNIVGSRGTWWLLDLEAFGNVVVPLYDAWHLVRTCSDLRRRRTRALASTPELWIDRIAGRGEESAASWHTISVAAREHGLDSNQIVAGLVYYMSHIAVECHMRGGPRWSWEPHIREARRLAHVLPDLAARSCRVSHVARGRDDDSMSLAPLTGHSTVSPRR